MYVQNKTLSIATYKIYKLWARGFREDFLSFIIIPMGAINTIGHGKLGLRSLIGKIYVAGH